jgi:hypothetical protein
VSNTLLVWSGLYCGYSASSKSVGKADSEWVLICGGSACPTLRPTLNGFQRGPHSYTQEEVDDILVLGIEAKRIKKRRKERRNRVRGSIDKVKN